MTIAPARPGDGGVPALGAGTGVLLKGSVYSVVALAVTAATGAVFWLVAARLYPADAVGQASALFTSLLFVNFLTNLGVPVALARFSDETREEYDALFSAAATVSAVVSAVAACVYLAAVDPSAADALRARGSVPAMLLFAVLVAGTSLAILVDVRLMVARRWRWIVLRVAAVGVLRLPLLWVDAGVNDTVWLFVLSAVPPAASGFVGLAALRWFVGARLAWRRPQLLGVAVRYAGINYLATLAVDGARFALPVLVLVHVTPAENASFYVAWSITAIAFLVPATIGQVLVVEATRATDRWSHVRAATFLTVVLMSVGFIVAVVRADLITALYGDSYGRAADVLPRLMAAGIPWALTSVALADARVRRETGATLGITIALGAAVLGPAVLLVAAEGVDGAADAWLMGHVVAATVAAATLVRARWRDRDAVPHAAPAT